MALLLNKYPAEFIANQFDHIFQKFNIDKILTSNNDEFIRGKVINSSKQRDLSIDYRILMLIYLAFCLNMK